MRKLKTDWLWLADITDGVLIRGLWRSADYFGFSGPNPLLPIDTGKAGVFIRREYIHPRPNITFVHSIANAKSRISPPPGHEMESVKVISEVQIAGDCCALVMCHGRSLLSSRWSPDDHLLSCRCQHYSTDILLMWHALRSFRMYSVIWDCLMGLSTTGKVDRSYK